MSNKIEFIDFNITKRSIICTCKTYLEAKLEKTDTLEFHFNRDVRPNNNLITLALATLCGKNYAEIYFDLEVSTQTINDLVTFTGANIKVLKVDTTKMPPFLPKEKNKILLNFSGGFDSLAALCLMPNNAELVAIDFGGWFERETNLFKKFNPHIVTTNFRQLKYDRSSWTFMGVAAILFSEYLDASYNVFGTILEGTPYHFVEAKSHTTNVTVPPFSHAGLKDIKYVAGLTEVGTAMVISHYKPEIINESLISLSAPETEKRYRKQLLTQIVCKKYNKNIELVLTDAPKNQIKFGSNFALDFLALYEIKNAGLEQAQKTLSNIPEEAIELANNLTLSFYEKLNTNFLNTIPSDLRHDYLDKLAQANIYPYDELDWKEFRIVTNFLAHYHESLNKLINPPISPITIEPNIAKPKKNLLQYFFNKTQN